ncbi:hypothetical protein [Streptomyces sp. NPDC056527]|uniref:hypothetical protein n=1 Tax=Streptomyces sp. NPDC056527 TaxID=3345853 RepID=UPI0036C3BCED
MGEYVDRAPRTSGLPVLPAEPAEAAERSAVEAGQPGPRDPSDGLWARLRTRRGHALGIIVLLFATALFSWPLHAEIRAQVETRLPDAPEGALGIGAAVGWSTATLANIATVGVLAVLFGVLGALGMKWAAPSEEFTAQRRTFTLAWALFVLVKLVGWTLLAPLLGGEAAQAVPSLTRIDWALPLLFGALLWAARAAGRAPWPRACAVACAVTGLYVGSLLALPS